MSAEWTSREPFVVTEAMIGQNWAGRGRIGLSCGFCHHLFQPGDVARWVIGKSTLNFFVCEEDDGPKVAERFAQRWRLVIAPILQLWGDRP